MKDAAQNRTALSYDSKFFISKVHTISTITAQPSILYQYTVYFLGYQNVHALKYIGAEVLFFFLPLLKYLIFNALNEKEAEKNFAQVATVTSSVFLKFLPLNLHPLFL